MTTDQLTNTTATAVAGQLDATETSTGNRQEMSTAWSRVPHDEIVFGGDDDQRMSSVTGSKSGFVAVGNDYSGGDGDGAVWTSPDGYEWSRVPHDEAVFGGDNGQEMWSVAVSASRLVAVGDDDSDGDFDVATWMGDLDGGDS